MPHSVTKLERNKKYNRYNYVELKVRGVIRGMMKNGCQPGKILYIVIYFYMIRVLGRPPIKIRF